MGQLESYSNGGKAEATRGKKKRKKPQLTNLNRKQGRNGQIGQGWAMDVRTTLIFGSLGFKTYCDLGGHEDSADLHHLSSVCVYGLFFSNPHGLMHDQMASSAWHRKLLNTRPSRPLHLCRILVKLFRPMVSRSACTIAPRVKKASEPTHGNIVKT